ncbi:hypothetical protein A2572_00910 [Candidatus Collierbacteria bacterium RIFOXYD1_FULL_40_9]|uniref:Uncharacterized protein n=1 Tax=Candidatus Collierbacteria bacterium RIFOXYD1_FULL_40_9 TaxID=1817731 RepID=A0A1F5FVX2_9BACT|nr:MAG: hypothetical protein A2572_00910 [Candidatus Collierbacteria bacterium RIFOXYD1_FULL_40_9]
MEIPRIYRETRARVEFAGRIIKESEKEKKINGHDLFNYGEGFMYFKYPGGDIPIYSEADFAMRLEKKGFGEVEVAGILDLFWRTVAAKAAVASSEVLEGVF